MNPKKLCVICGSRERVQGAVYNAAVHHDMALIRIFDREAVCCDCHSKITNGALLALNTQLPLPPVKYGKPLGVFATRAYLSQEFIVEYTGTILNDPWQVAESKSDYIIQRFTGKIPLEDQTWIDGDGIGNCFVYFVIFFVDAFITFYYYFFLLLLLLYSTFG